MSKDVSVERGLWCRLKDGMQIPRLTVSLPSLSESTLASTVALGPKNGAILAAFILFKDFNFQTQATAKKLPFLTPSTQIFFKPSRHLGISIK